VNLDALTLAAIRDEIVEHCIDGRVQRVVQPSSTSIGIEVYAGRRFQLLIDAQAQTPCVLLTEDKLRRGVEKPSPLGLLLAKYVRGARLVDVKQPLLERVLHLSFRHPKGETELICEIMGRYSNIILLDNDGTILDAIKRVPPSLNRYRSTLPQHRYVAPPPQDKEGPLGLTQERLGRILAQSEGKPVWRSLVSGVMGISPILAQEIVYRATGEVDPPRPLDADRVVAILETLLHMLRPIETHEWAPTIAYQDGRAVAYAPYELTHLGKAEPIDDLSEPTDSMSDAIRRVQDAKTPFDAYEQVRARLHGLVDDQVKRQKSKLHSLRESLVPASEIERLQLYGSAILAMAWSIAPGQSELVIDPTHYGVSVLEGRSEEHIPLDPELSPSENAQKLFRTYRRRKAAADQVPQHIAETKLEMAYLAQLGTEIDMAENRPALDEVEQELREAGYVSRKKKRAATAKGTLLTCRAPDDTLILVGRNSVQNDEVTFRRGAPDDLWLHAHGVPGSHVIIKCAGRPVSAATLAMAARLAAHYSASKGEGRVQVDYTERRYVRHIKGAHAGMVTYTHEETIIVEATLDDLDI